MGRDWGILSVLLPVLSPELPIILGPMLRTVQVCRMASRSVSPLPTDYPPLARLMSPVSPVPPLFVGGAVTTNGGFNILSRGICYSTTPDPTISGPHTSDGVGLGSYVSQMAGLTSNTTYYVRAYATNSVGTVYGEQRTFTTTH